MGFEWYTDFVEIGYKPENEIVCVFRAEPDGISMEECAGRIASESSVGTWTTLSKLPETIKRLMAKAFRIEGNLISVSYPLDLFEEGNIPQLLSSVAGNIFGMRALKSLRLEEIQFPDDYLRFFKGPAFGVEVRKKLKIRERPITATVPKPKVGYDADEYAEIAYNSLSGGIDLLKDDENLTSQPFIRFEKRLEKVMRVMERVEMETGEKKGYLVNITAECKEMGRRLELVANHGNEFVMIDILTAGFSSLQTLRDLAEDYNIAIHAHRAMHGVFTRKPDHGISLRVLTKLARLAGVDHMHVGTGVGKMAGTRKEVEELLKVCREKMGKLRQVMPVSSGGLHPGLIPDVLDIFGKDVIIQVGGGIHGHPDGSEAGAKALRDAIDSALNGIPLEEYAEKSIELRKALDKWGYVKPK